jgi:hypothetical protein
MSVGQLPPRPARRPADDARLVQYDQYIDTQIHATRRAVKAVDVATALVVLAAGVIAFLLAAAVVEHWLVPGGFSVPVRSALFLCLVGTLCYFAYRQLWPLCRRSINPVYAAHTIERHSPGLKNSLINLLLFRQNRAQIPEAVYNTLEEQAAHGLTRVPIEAAVDRSLLIRVGYVLLVVVALAGLYKVLSPKDPIIAAERILFPWSDIVPASRVSISAVTPGAVTRARGEFVDISALVLGIDEDDPVLLRYTTADGQSVDQPIEMKLAKDALRYEARLPDDLGQSATLGLAQNLTYRIEAGDARTLDFEVTVVPAPSILVERVEYNYPDYTGFLDRQVEGLGDIRAIEGTRVTVHARANGGIQQAHIDFDADGRPDRDMETAITQARASFELALREDRQTPRHASYVIRFTNSDGRANRDPVKHPIAVEPDLAPEAGILLPHEKLLDVELDDTVTIEVEARDPDFALSKVWLHGEVAGRAVMDEELLTTRHKGRFTARHQFTLSGHDLRPGDIIDYWVIANDNRAPAGNAAESEHKQLRIASPNPGRKGNQPPPDRIAQNDRPRNNEPQQQDDEQRQGDKETRRQGEGGQSGNQNQGGEAQPTAEQNQADGEVGSATGKEADGSQDGVRPSAADGARDPASSDSKQKPNREQTGAGSAGGESQQGSQPDGTRPDRNNTGQPTDGQRERGGEQRQPNEDQSPVSSDGDNDAEAFSRIREHMRESGELKQGESDTAEDNQFSREPQASHPEGTRPRQGDKESRSQGGENESNDGESGSADRSQKNDTNTKPQDNNQNSAAQPDKATSPDQGAGTLEEKSEDQGSQESGGRARDQGEGPGLETRPHDLPDDSAPPQNGDQQGKSHGGQQTTSKGPSGLGNEQQSQGAANSQPEMKPADKRQQLGSGEQTDREEPSAGSRGRRESDSQGEEGGDKAGGGEEGGGQKSPREGTGSAGQNQSADEGAGESSEKGTGNTSPNAGQDTAADRRTGQPGGETTGRGSKTREATDGKSDSADKSQFSRKPQSSANEGQGDKETGRLGEESPDQKKPTNGEPASATGSEPKDGNEPGSANEPRGDNEPGGRPSAADGARAPARSPEQLENQPGGTPTGDGGQQGTDSQASSSQGEAPPADAANLNYAREQTDLVLDKLANQLNRKRVDKTLLDKLGWNEDDLRRFVERWQRLKDTAQQTDPAGESAQRDLDDALRSLGLRRGPLQQGPVKDDMQRDLRQGYRGPVPPKYQDQLRRYNEAISRARETGEK